MKILIYNNQIQYGGAERVLSILANSLSGRGHQVRFFLSYEHTPSYDISPSVELVFHSHLPRFRNPISVFKEICFLKKEVKTFLPDVIITFFSENTFIAHFAIPLRLNTSLIFSQRTDPSKSKGRKRVLNWLAAKWANGVVLQSDAVKELYDESVRKKSRVIINPFSAEKLPVYDIKLADKILINVGRLAKKKNQNKLIEAFAIVTKSFPDYRLFIYGDGPERQNLQELIHSLGIEKKVFLPGTTNMIWEKMKNSRLFVLSSDYEGIPNVLIEAMCMGMPCISTDFTPSGAVKELIVQGENGIIVPLNDTKALAESIMMLISDECEAQRLGDNARSLILKVNVETVTNLWEDFLLGISRTTNK